MATTHAWSILLAGVLAAAAPASAETFELLRPTSWPASLPPRGISPDARPVAMEIAGLANAALDDAIAVDLDLDGVVTAIVTRVERRSPSSVSVACRLESEPDGFALFALDGDAVAALIQAPSLARLYSIRYVAAGVHEIGPDLPIEIPDCATVDEGSEAPPAETPERATSPLTSSCPQPSPNGDVMIYYTPDARIEAGGVSAMNAAAQLAVDVANQTYVDSQITNHLTLISCEEISYTEAGWLQTDRDRLKGTSDGFMDQVHANRDAYGGDFVALFVRDSDASGCGIAFCLPSGAPEGFCVVDWTCASNNFSFAHEIGHLQGCAHNKEDAGSGCNNNCYSFGHRFPGNSQFGWRTVMAYDTDPPSFSRIGIWSNPGVTFDGQPCGVWTGDCNDDNRFNAATVTNTASNREGWRDPKFDVWVTKSAPSPWNGTWTRPFPSLQAGVAAVFAGGSTPARPVLHVQSQTYLEHPTLSKRMTIVACGGTVRIGG